MTSVSSAWLRAPGQNQIVTPLELLFDLVYVFTVSQLSLALFDDLTWRGAAEAAILTFASISVWSNTMWVTSLFDTRRLPVRSLLLGVMVVSVFLTTSITGAFGDRSMIFAIAYVTTLLGRPAFILLSQMDGPLRAHFVRTLIWACLTSVGWIVGAAVGGISQPVIWGAMVIVEFLIGWYGHPLPSKGHTETIQYSLAGEHLGERTRLFFLIALGETILTSCTAFIQEPPTLLRSAALLIALTCTIGIWWSYFQRSESIGLNALERSSDQASVGRQTVLSLTIMVAGIILAAVGDEIAIVHPSADSQLAPVIAIVAGPLIFFAAQLGFVRSVTGHLGKSRVFAIGSLVAVGAGTILIPKTQLIAVLALTAAIIVAVAINDSVRPSQKQERQYVSAPE